MQDPCPWSWVTKQHNTIHNPLQPITTHYNPLQPITTHYKYNTMRCPTMRRRSWNNSDNEIILPIFDRSDSVDSRICSSSEKRNSTTIKIMNMNSNINMSSSSSTTKTRTNASMKMVWNVATMILVFVLGYVIGHIDDKKIDINNNSRILRVNSENNHDRNIIDTNDENDDGNTSNDDLLRHNWRDTIEADQKTIMNPDKYTLVEDSPPFVFRFPQLKEFQMSPLYWASSGKQVDRDARVVGLPPRLTHEVRNFCEDIGLLRLFQRVAQSSSMKNDEIEITGPGDLKKDHTWAITRAGSGDHLGTNNLHYLDVADEISFEETAEVLNKGKFDDVLDVIAAEFRPWGFMVTGIRFMVASHSEASKIHKTNQDGGKNSLNLVFPIYLSEHKVAQLYVGNEEEKMVAPVDLDYHHGLLVGGDTTHGTANYDYRKDGGFQVFASITIADLHNDNLDKIISGDRTAIFPGQTEWLMAQQGRFWGGTQGGSFEFDTGRKPFQAVDALENCNDLAQRGLCLKSSESKDDPNLWDVRTHCPQSCGIYIDDATYFTKVRPPPQNPVSLLQ